MKRAVLFVLVLTVALAGAAPAGAAAKTTLVLGVAWGWLQTMASRAAGSILLK